METYKEVIGHISRYKTGNEELSKLERSMEQAAAEWIDNLSKQIWIEQNESAVDEVLAGLAYAVESLFPVAGSPGINALIGKAVTVMINHEMRSINSRRIMQRFLTERIAGQADKDLKRILVVNVAQKATKLAYFEGIEKKHATALYLSLDEPDGVEPRIEAIMGWLSEIGVALDTLEGICSRSGFFNPVPTGTYRIVPDMVSDLTKSRFDHASNLSVPIVTKLAEMSGHADRMLLTTSDPSVSDEIETVERLTGFNKIKRDGTGVHYLNHKGIARVIAGILGRPAGELNIVTAHLGNGISLALQRNGRVTAVIDAFTGVPSSNRCGPLGLQRVLEALKGDMITIKELEKVTFSQGGLISLTGTDDFRTLDGFRQKGATEIQKKKIDLIFEFFARQITAAALKLTSDGGPVELVALSGGLVRSTELIGHIDKNLGGRYPLVLAADSIELESLAAGLITSLYNPSTIKDYVKERNALAALRQEENKLFDTVVFDRTVSYRRKGAPILSMDDLHDAVQITVRENFLPTIAIVGANNEEAILAAKRANEEGNFRIAKFKLVGDFAAINQIAYDFDLIIDNDNFSIVDSDDPVTDAINLIETGEADILMKGKMHTAHILKGVFHYLKETGRLKHGELITHIFAMDIPVRNKLLLISDAAVNTYPNEEKRIKILENTLRVARGLNIRKPKVAVISAIETVNTSVESSMEARRIAERFATREDCIVEGPLSFDVAMDPAIAYEKGYTGQIAGTADILIMPDIDAGNVLYKSLTTQSGAISAGVILGGDMPMILTSRGDSARSKLASICLAVKLFFDLREKK